MNRINKYRTKNHIIDLESCIDEDASIGRETDERFMNELNVALQPLSTCNLSSASNLSSSSNVSSSSLILKNADMHETTDLRGSISPMTLSSASSVNSSSVESSSEESNDENRVHDLNLLQNKTKKKKKKKRFHKLSLIEIERSLDTFDNNCKFSNELDIIITYLNGQKHLYLHSKIHTHFKLNLLMVPTLLISTVVTSLSQFISIYNWSSIAIPILNAILTLLLSLVSYFKFEANTQTYSNMAAQYDKLQTVLQLANSRLMFIDDASEKKKLVVKTIQEFEIKICEIKDSNNIFIPETVKRKFQIISNINILTFIKRIATYRKSLIFKFRDAKNEVRYILYNINQRNIHDKRYKMRLIYLTKLKTKIRDELGEYKNAYSYMDDAFVQEIKNAGVDNYWSIPSIYGYKHKQVVQHDIIKKHMPQF
jgi:hypothetical protein